jgi:hypothetical protein
MRTVFPVCDVSFTLSAIAPFVLIAAAIAAAAAGILRRIRSAAVSLVVAVLALVIPFATGLWCILTLPAT